MVGSQSTSSPALVSDAQGSTPSAQNRANQNRVVPLSNTYVVVLRQQMDDNNHELVNMLTNQMGTVFNPIVQELTESNRQVVDLLTRLCNYLGAPQTTGRQPPQAHRQVVVHTPTEDDSLDEETVPQNQIPMWRPNQGGVRGRQQVVMVGRQQDADQFVEQYQQEEVAMENNLTTTIERIMARNKMNTPLEKPTYSSPLVEYIVQTENPRGWKIPKYTKFGGETGESKVENIARYPTESGDMANNESLRVKHFPSSLTKAIFTWFTTLPPNSIDSWPKLEKLFHEQFYEGHSKISLVELSSIKRRFVETIDDYLNRFRSLKAKCFTQVPEHELVQMAARGLDYSIRKKIDPTFVKSMSQLADRVRHLELLRLEKVRHTKAKAKKERVAYVDYDDTDPIYEADYISPTKAEIDLAEMKPGPAYECKSLFSSKGKNVPVDNNSKLPPLEQRQKRGFCKCHNYLGHSTSQCFLFRDLVQKSLQEGRLKFAARRMKIDADPLK
ncbi:uncharacterized protein LOC131662505 [Vicia villosa]|uniref:uncharacterized protein LOC131662505 n=1 Tax=Vicia villosa TaxID=3911 RepID=UPI00273BB0B2|nr:uncharacterized protein LOC131662505 [Vicia villosa]